MNQNSKKKKTAMAIAIVVACVICLIGMFFMQSGNAMTAYIEGLLPEETKKPQLVYDGYGEHRISLWDPDWETDIFTVDRWLDKNRYLTYVENGIAITITDGAYNEYGDTVAFMAEYFDTLMHGDAEALNGFYADSYFDEHDRFDAITMQKIYDMRMEYVSAQDKEYTTSYVYKITYKILENDGTFRDDIPSDGVRAQFYTLLDDGYEIKITNVAYSYAG